jgi:hypothetical protein
MSFRFPAKWAGALLAAVTALSLIGCNKLKFGYEYADWLVIYSVEDNFDLDKSQRALLKEDVAGFFRWHRSQLLPAYADYLDFVSGSIRGGLRPAEIDTGFNRYKLLYRRTMEPIADKSVHLLKTLSPEQVDAWLDKQRKKNQKLRKDFSGTQEERLDHRYRKIVEELEDWTGRLSKDQKGRIKALNATLPWNGFLWLEMREKVQDSLSVLLKKKVPEQELRGFLNAYYLDTDSLRSEEYRAKYKDFEVRLHGMIYAVHNSLTADQKRRFIQQVEKLSRDLRTMSKQD